MQILSGLSHLQRLRVNQPLGQKSRIWVDTFTHRVSTHVLDATGDSDVIGPGHDGRG
jgi:hypothetical protein